MRGLLDSNRKTPDKKSRISILNLPSRKAQMKLSFGMIFSIILIIVFLAFTIYAITKFLGIQRTLQAGTFVNDLQGNIDRMWKGGQGSEVQTYTVPSKSKAVCFADFNSPKKGPKESIYNELSAVFFEKENLVFYPVGSAEGIDAKIIDHLNITKITKVENPFCITTDKGKVKLTVKMSPGDSLVTIERAV